MLIRALITRFRMTVRADCVSFLSHTANSRWLSIIHMVGWGGRLSREGVYVYLWLIHVEV